MRKIVRYIALFLATVFITPLAYQSWHIVHHRAVSEQPGCHVTHLAVGQTDHTPHRAFTSQPASLQLNPHKATCWLCDYEFATTQLAQNGEHTTWAVLCGYLETPNIYTQASAAYRTHYLTRGPPVA